MTKYILIYLILFAGFISRAQMQNDPKLLGKCSITDLKGEPYNSWYVKNFDEYSPNPEITRQLSKVNWGKYKMTIFLGTWCGDSKREVPRMARLLQSVSFPENQIEIIAIDNSDERYKQSPNHEEEGKSIYRVPIFIISKSEKEIGRIVEFPVESLERDLLTIVEGRAYTPNYDCYTAVNRWLDQGLLSDGNVNPRGLCSQLTGKVQYESELNSCGYVLMRKGKLNEAITLFRVNVNLFPKSANCYDSLGEAYALAGVKDKAITCYERALQLDPASENAKEQLKKLKGE